MATVSSPPRPQRLVLHGVSWTEYTRMLRAFEARPNWRLTFDRGVLEIMSPRPEHESDADFLGRLVVVLTEELDLPIKAARSTTFRRRRLKRGIEADHSWWITNEGRVRGKRRIDLRVDPPPDLAIEADLRRRPIDRMSIYTKLRVPELWELDVARQQLIFHVLGSKGRYTEAAYSLVFPQFTPADLLPFLALRSQFDENEVVRRFRLFVRERLKSPPQ